MQEKTFMAQTQIAKRTYRAYDKNSPSKAYTNLLSLLKENGARVSTKSFFIVREVDYDPSNDMISYSIFGGSYGISGKKNEVESLLSMAA